MSQSGVSPLYADGPHFLFESFASFSEMLLADSLEAGERDPALRRFFHEQFLEGKGTVMFVAGPEAALEQAVYTREPGTGTCRRRGSRRADPADLCALLHLAGARARAAVALDGDPADVRGSRSTTSTTSMPGSSPSSTPRSRSRTRAGFATRYTALLEHGFDAPPAELLKKYLGIELDDRKLVTDALRVLEAKMMERGAAD